MAPFILGSVRDAPAVNSHQWIRQQRQADGFNQKR
jgi:hypothetical protein